MSKAKETIAMTKNPTLAYLEEKFGITPEQVTAELKATKVNVGFFLEPIAAAEDKAETMVLKEAM